MTKALSAEEKRIRQTKRDEKKIEKLLNPKLDERCIENASLQIAEKAKSILADLLE